MRSTASNTFGDAPPTQFKPGQIVRVNLQNFVTYTAATFNPGPALNMVIGPNGTGKSTLVCALCIGLGWSTSLLGRAKDLGEFVKHGCPTATIEIELKGQQGRINPVVRREIIRDGNKSQFYLNGSTTTLTNIKQLSREFNIQIDNLCQFLPQDRVVEFSRLTPKERLESTQAAAAPEYMQVWHSQLKSLRAEQVQALQKQSDVQRNLQNLEGRQNLQRADVERMRERNEILEKVDMLEKSRPYSEYHYRKVQTRELMTKAQQVEKEFAEIDDAMRPALKVVKQKQDYQQKVDKAVELRKKLVEKCQKEIDRCQKRPEKTDEMIGKCEGKKSEELDAMKRAKQSIVKAQHAIVNLEIQQEQRPPDIDAAAYNERMRELTREKSEIATLVHDIGEKIRSISVAITNRTVEVENTKGEIANLQSQAGQQIQKLRSHHKDAATAWDWIRKNPQAFQGQVFGPPLVECKVKDPQNASMIESIFQPAVFGAITCTDQRDFNFLSKHLRQTMGLGRITLRTSNMALDDPRNAPPLEPDQMRSMGVDSWALDHLEGPAPVLAMLCNEESIHATAILAKDCDDDQFRRLEDSPVDRFITPRFTYQVRKRREYGPAAKSTMSREVREGKFWRSQGVDRGAEATLKGTMVQLEGETEELQRERTAAQRRQSELRERSNDFGTQLVG